MTGESEAYLEAGAVQRRLGISRATYHRWLREGRLQGVKVGRRWRFPESMVDQLLAGREPPGASSQRALAEGWEIGARRLRTPDGDGSEETRPGQPTGEDLAEVVLQHALRRGASDLHIAPVADGVSVRERIHGVLQELEPLLPAEVAGPLVEALKRRAGMSADERHRPQDGRFFASVEDRKIDIRASTFPTVLGDSITLRLLDPQALALRLQDAGFSEAIQVGIRRALGRPSGVFVVNGPTGQGKTTTLYCLLRELYRPSLKIMTAEDPVELCLDGVLQTAVRPGFTFRDAMVAMLRNDLDVCMISEMRDRECIQLLFRMASTGHLALTALHAPDGVGALQRIVEMAEVEPRMVIENLRGVLNQRLIRRSCPHCRTRGRLDPDAADRLGLTGKARRMEVAGNGGCESCRGTGTLGRTVAADLLVLTPSLASALEAGQTSREDLETALPPDFRPLRAEVLERLAAGDITPEGALEALSS